MPFSLAPTRCRALFAIDKMLVAWAKQKLAGSLGCRGGPVIVKPALRGANDGLQRRYYVAAQVLIDT